MSFILLNVLSTVAVLTGSAIIILSSFHVSGKTPSYVFDFIISSRISCIVGDKIGEFLRSISDFTFLISSSLQGYLA